MRAQLLALAAFLAAAAQGVYFVNWNDGSADQLADRFGNLEVVDKSQCSTSTCNAAACVQANNILADAGSACVVRFVECPVRFGQKARNYAADAGVAFTAARYQQVRVIAMRCGSTFGVPVNDAGWPVFMTASVALPCAWKPSSGAVCTLIDGGDPGVENSMQPGFWVGAGCVRKACVEIAGESSAP